MRPADLIARKRDGYEHTPEEIAFLVRTATDGSLPDYQLSAWLMAVYFRGMTPEETLHLTLAMRDSGEVVHLEGMHGLTLDKHSSGGVGDKVTLVALPLLAAAGVPMLKMSGRALGFSGGTIDKMEAISGFRTDLSITQATRQVREVGCALIGQSPTLAPADKKLYALRDVTATVESIPLIAASIMSKKLAGGADVVLLDVKVGQGAFMKTRERARELAETLVAIGKGAGVRTVAALTPMEEPLGYAVGNALEVREAIATLTGRGRVDENFRSLCLLLASRGLVLTKRAVTDIEAYTRLEDLLASGAAAQKFADMITAQDGDSAVVDQPDLLPTARTVQRIRATKGGWVENLDAEAIGRLSMEMGAGREHKEDPIDLSVGITLMKKRGDEVKENDVLADLHLPDNTPHPEYTERLRAAYEITAAPPPPLPLVYEFVE